MKFDPLFLFQANSPEDIPPVIATGFSYLISIFRNDLFFVSVVENEGLYQGFDNYLLQRDKFLVRIFKGIWQYPYTKGYGNIPLCRDTAISLHKGIWDIYTKGYLKGYGNIPTQRDMAISLHNIYTQRRKNDLHLPKTNTNKGKQRPSYQASKDFNNLGPDIRNANSLYKFKALLKNAV
jgi:hypothetical protein